MGSQTKIEWSDATWTPIRSRNLATGKIGWHCETVSDGCRNCYSKSINKRLGTGLDFKPGHRKDIEVFLDETMLLAPLRWRKPRMIFVCSMTDLFADFVKDEWIDRMFAVMANCPQHVFQCLSKRSWRMRRYCCDIKTPARIWSLACEAIRRPAIAGSPWPLKNCWLGVSAEDQETADVRIPDLLATPAAVRFVSYEPALGPVDFTPWLEGREDNGIDMTRPVGQRVGACVGWQPPLDWVICGGESGPNARPMHPDWARDVRDQCKAAGAQFFFKQWGEYAPADEALADDLKMVRLGKRAAGRMLDGRTYDEMPQVNQE